MAEPRCTRFYISDILDAENTFVTGDEQRDLHRNREIICTRSNPRSRWLDDIHGLEREGERRVKRPRTSFSAEQINLLESEFHSNKYIAVPRRLELSQALGLSESQIKIWFQNRRTKWKRKFTSTMDVTIRHLHQHNQIYTIGGLPAWLLSPLQGVSTLQGSLSASEAISSAAPLNNADNRDNAPSDQFAKQPRSLLPN